MIGMSFSPFFTLLVLGLISSFVLHVLFRYRVLPGVDGFLSKWVAGWIGGWLAAPVFGHWGGLLGNIYILPAILGAFVGPFMLTAALRALARTVPAVPRQETAPSQQGAASQFELRKAS